MPRQVPNNPGFPPRSAALSAEVREQQRRNALARQGANALSEVRIMPPTVPWPSFEQAAQYDAAEDRIRAMQRQRELEAERRALSGVTATTATTFHGRSIADVRYDPELMSQLMQTISVKPPHYMIEDTPLPRATVTPRQMIEKVVRDARLNADAQFVRRLHAEVRMPASEGRSLSHAEYELAKKELDHRLMGKLTEVVSKSTATVTQKHDPWTGKVRADASVVVMTETDLHQLIEHIGAKVLEEAKKNGFIR